MSMLHRVEDYGKSNAGDYIKLSFNTKYRGCWQCIISRNGLNEFTSEPPLHSLTAEEQQSVREIGAIAFYHTHGEWPEGLNAFST